MARLGGVLGSAMDEKALGQKLQLARKRAGLTQQELCQKAGLSYSTLAKIERGAIKSPSAFTVAAIAAATGSSMEELMAIPQSQPSAPANNKKRSKTGISFIYLDVNGTIGRFSERAFSEIASQSQMPAEIVETMFLHYDGAACRGSMSNDEVDQIFTGELGLADFSWQKYYLENIEATPGTGELLNWAAENFEIGLLTNNWLGFTDELINRGIIPKLNFKAIVESAKVGCSKPEAKIYEIAQELAGVGANEILLVDDNAAYLAAAEKAGWQTIHFDELQPDPSIAAIKQALEF